MAGKQRIKSLVAEHKARRAVKSRGNAGIDKEALVRSYSAALKEGLKNPGAREDFQRLFHVTKKSRHDAVRNAIHENALDRMGIHDKVKRDEIRQIVKEMEDWEWTRGDMGHAPNADSSILIQRRAELINTLGGK